MTKKKNNWEELDKRSVEKSIDRHNDVLKRYQDVKKVISDPDKWNVNIASRERMDIAYDRLDKLEEWSHEPQNYKTQCEAMEKRIEELEEKLGRVEDLNKRIDGLSYLVKQGINKKA